MSRGDSDKSDSSSPGHRAEHGGPIDPNARAGKNRRGKLISIRVLNALFVTMFVAVTFHAFVDMPQRFIAETSVFFALAGVFVTIYLLATRLGPFMQRLPPALRDVADFIDACWRKVMRWGRRLENRIEIAEKRVGKFLRSFR